MKAPEHFTFKFYKDDDTVFTALIDPDGRSYTVRWENHRGNYSVGYQASGVASFIARGAWIVQKVFKE